ncbi:MAG TPA: NADPH:quinone reductase, partial [Hyphomicrobiaceae bacterium]|nr:NADPH:quinone reductase [Hyphomicrobiaceae bacterium]
MTPRAITPARRRSGLSIPLFLETPMNARSIVLVSEPHPLFTGMRLLRLNWNAGYMRLGPRSILDCGLQIWWSGTMRAAWYERTGPAREVFVVGEMPAAEPGPGQVRVAIKTSGVNPSDVKARAGSRPMLASRIIPQSDGGGVIEKVGSGVPGERVGQRVWVWNGQWKRALGTCAEFITVPVEQAIAMPDPLTFEAAACLGIPALTAYRALATDGGVKDKIVLVAGGAGAVGHYAVQMAKLMGAAKVITTVSTPAKADYARAAGADEIINYRTENVAERLGALTHGHLLDARLSREEPAEVRVERAVVVEARRSDVVAQLLRRLLFLAHAATREPEQQLALHRAVDVLARDLAEGDGGLAPVPEHPFELPDEQRVARVVRVLLREEQRVLERVRRP